MERDHSVLNKRKNYISVRNNINTFKKERKTICHLEMCFPLTDPFFFFFYTILSQRKLFLSFIQKAPPGSVWLHSKAS